MVLLHRWTLIPAAGLEAARVRAELRLRLRSARRVGKAISILSTLRRTRLVIPLLRSGTAGVAAFVHLWPGARTIEARAKGVAIFRPAIGHGLWAAGLFADAVLIGPRTTLGHLRISRTLMAVVAMMMVGLRAEVSPLGAVASIAAVVAITVWRGAFAARAVIARAGVAVTVRFAVVVLVHLWSTIAVLVTVAFGAEIGSTAVTVGAAIAVTFRTWSVAARAGIGRARGTLIALAFAGFAALGTTRLAFAGTTEFIDTDLAVVVAIELPEQIAGAIHFLVIDDAVAIGIERAEKSGHGALWAVAAFGAGSAFTRRGVRRAGWRSVFLSGQRPRGQRESEGGDKEMPGFHDGWVLG